MDYLRDEMAGSKGVQPETATTNLYCAPTDGINSTMQNRDEREESQSTSMTQTWAAYQSNVVIKDISASRKGPPKKNIVETARGRFNGSCLYQNAFMQDVQVLRLSCLPEGANSFHSTAVCVEPLWSKMEPEAKLPFEMTWQQSMPARFDFRFKLPTHIRCLGLGERYSGLDLRGTTNTLCNSDNSKHNESTDPMYLSIPFCIFMNGAEATGIFLDTPAPQIWDLDSDRTQEAHIKLLSRHGWQLNVIGPTTLPKVLEIYTTLTGRTNLPPLWSLGYQQCRFSYASEDVVREIATSLRERAIPCDTIVLDIDYMDDYRVFTTAPDRFPDMKRLIDDLAQQGFKVVTITDPCIKADEKDKSFQEGLEKEVFCRTAGGDIFQAKVWPGLCAFPDFMRAQVRNWWTEKLKFLTDMGVAGIWNDMNEPTFLGLKEPLPKQLEELPAETDQLFMQETAKGPIGHFEVRNIYGNQMSESTAEALLRANPEARTFVLSRAGYAGIQRNAAIWLGDNMSWFEHLKKSVPMLLNASLSGLPFVGVDVGGFNENVTPELLVRWNELGIFYPFFRNHCVMTARAQEPWAFSEKIENAIRRLIQTRYQLLPYINALFWEHTRTGAPLMRPLFWHYPDDENVREIDDQFMFGENILVTPVLERSKTRRLVYFPEGRWYPFDGGSAIEGNQSRMVELPLGCVPAFIKEGTILPLVHAIQHTGDYQSAPIYFHIYGNASHGRYFEDDGSTDAYRRGHYNEYALMARNGEFAMEPLHIGLPNDGREFFVVQDSVKTAFSPFRK